MAGGLSVTASRARGTPAEGRAGLDRSGSRRRVRAAVAVDSDVGDDGLVDGLGSRASARSNTDDCGGRESGHVGDNTGPVLRRLCRVDCDFGRIGHGGCRGGEYGLVACGEVGGREVGHGQPGRVEGGSGVLVDGSRARDEGGDGGGCWDGVCLDASIRLGLSSRSNGWGRALSVASSGARGDGDGTGGESGNDGRLVVGPLCCSDRANLYQVSSEVSQLNQAFCKLTVVVV